MAQNVESYWSLEVAIAFCFALFVCFVGRFIPLSLLREDSTLLHMSTDAAAAVPKPGAKRRRAPTDPIERVNRKNDEVFIAEHLLLPARQQPGALDGTDGGGSSPADWTQWTHPRTRDRYRLHLARTANLSDADLQACFDLIDETSREDYEQSSFGWKPSRKLAEMRSPDLRYILVRQDPGQDPDRAPDGAPLPLCGFVSLMPTYEDGFPVVYCYEIHLKPDLQG